MKWCSKCLIPNTRPNIKFDSDGVCAACQWHEMKRTINWQERQDYFRELCAKYKVALVPYSGGKDSIYVAHKVEEAGAEPILITILPDLETEIGEWNRKNMRKGFRWIEIKLPGDECREQARECFIDNGKVKHPWENAISARVLQEAAEKEIPFVVYGEEGGAEYGGGFGYEISLNDWKKPVSAEYLKKYYYLNKVLFGLPSNYTDLFFTQYSRFENWSPAKHRAFAVGKGMRTLPVRSIGTFTCDSQLSDILQDLHCYILFIKFGFGRATSDACIAIRDGTLDRGNALEQVENYDGDFPNNYLPHYLDYLKMDYNEFCTVLEKHANPEIVEQASHPKARHVFYLKSWLGKKRRKGTSLEFISPLRWDLDKTRRY